MFRRFLPPRYDAWGQDTWVHPDEELYVRDMTPGTDDRDVERAEERRGSTSGLSKDSGARLLSPSQNTDAPPSAERPQCPYCFKPVGAAADCPACGDPSEMEAA